MTLVKRGIIHDGCNIVAKGTVRIKEGDVCIESMHNLIAVDGKNFSELCEPTKYRTEQGQLTTNEDEELKARLNELTQEKEQLTIGMQNKINDLQAKLEREYSLRLSIEEREKKVSTETANVITQLSTKKEEVETLQSKLEYAEGLVKELQSRLESEGSLLEQRGLRIQSLLNEKEAKEKRLERAESLQDQLDSTIIMLGEKEDKMQTLQEELGKKEDTVQEVKGKEKNAKVAVAELKNQVALMEAERMEDKKNSAIMLDDFSQWRGVAEDELTMAKKELEHSRTTITTLKNELEVAELEESEFNTTITELRNENNELRKRLQLAAAPAEPEEKPSRKIRTSQSLKYLVKIIKPKEKDATTESKKERKEREKRNSVASNPSV